MVARVGERIVGSILCGSDGRQGALYHVCVAKEYRRKGIGTRMVGFCMHQLRYMGINKVALIAFARNDAGNAFWKQIGWKQGNVNYYEFVLNEKNITRFIGSGRSMIQKIEGGVTAARDSKRPAARRASNIRAGGTWRWFSRMCPARRPAPLPPTG